MTDPKSTPLEEWVFLYLTHELRTPMNALLGFSQMLRDGAYGELNAKQQDRLDRVVRSAQVILRRLDLLLDFDRLHQGQLDLSRARVTLKELLDVALAAADYDNRGRRLQVALPEEMLDAALAVNLSWGGVAVREVILHAASEAMPDPTVWLQAEPCMQGTHLALGVRYNAPPMDTWQRGNLFTLNNRTGIGLPLALQLLSRMDGSIDYESEATRHVITLTLPLAEA